MSKTQRSMAEALRRAYENPDSCPPSETFLAEEMAALDSETRSAIEAHAEQCPACGSELELARIFENEDSMTAAESREVDRIVRGLERVRGSRKSGLARLFRFPTGSARSPLFQVAAAAMLVIAVGFFLQTSRPGPPALPDTASDTVVRGVALTVLSPVGEIEAMADELAWEAVDSAATYRVTLEAVDETVLWETTGPQASAPLPEAVRARLHQAVKYIWRVDAFDSEGVRIAGSGPIEFRVRASAS